jgi:hypothetical protein
MLQKFAFSSLPQEVSRSSLDRATQRRTTALNLDRIDHWIQQNNQTATCFYYEYRYPYSCERVLQDSILCFNFTPLFTLRRIGSTR